MIGMLAQIEKLEQRQAELEREMAEPGFFEMDYLIVDKVTLELAELNASLGKAFERWDGLESGQEVPGLVVVARR